MKKGLIRTIEAFIAVYLLSMFLASIQIASIPRYQDPYNLERLNRHSYSISSAICNNDFHREDIIEKGEIPKEINLDEMKPMDLDSNIKLYNGSYFNELVDKTGNFSKKPGVGTSSCIVTTHDQNKIKKEEIGEENITINEGQSEIISFNIEENERGYENILVIEAIQSDAGETTILVQNETEEVEIGTVSFSQNEFERKTLDLTNYLPDAEDEYKIIVETNVETEYDHLTLEVSRIEPNYEPYKIVVGVWNK